MTAAGLALLAEAAAFAARRHDGQRRAGETRLPYTVHLANVAALTARSGGPGSDAAETIVAAMLHDAIEDAGVTEQELTDRFGASVSGLVLWLTDDPSMADAPLEARKAAQAEKIAAAPAPARLIKLADQTDNLEGCLADFAIWPIARHRRYLAGCRVVVAGCRGLSPSLEAQFDRAAAALEARIVEATAGDVDEDREPREGSPL